MNKISRLELCNRLSPDRFDKTAASLQQMMSNLGNSVKGSLSRFNKYLDKVPTFETPDQGFWKSLWNSATGYLNPKNYLDTVKHGIPLYLRQLRDTTFNPQAWRDDMLGTTLHTAGNVVAPYMAIKFLTEDNPDSDNEGFVQKSVKNIMNVADALDPSGGIMNRGVKGLVSPILGGMLGRFGAVPAMTKKIDDMLGTGVSKEKLTQRLMKRVEKEIPAFMQKNPNMSREEARDYVLQSTLSSYSPDAIQKLFS